jgi:hypothetical protein
VRHVRDGVHTETTGPESKRSISFYDKVVCSHHAARPVKQATYSFHFVRCEAMQLDRLEQNGTPMTLWPETGWEVGKKGVRSIFTVSTDAR